MGGLCCKKVDKIYEDGKVLDAVKERKLNLQRQCKINVEGEKILNISYSQHRFRGYKDTWEFDHKRLLICCEAGVHVCEQLDPVSFVYHRLLSWRAPQKRLLYAAFLDDQHSNFFMTIFVPLGGLHSGIGIGTYHIVRDKSKRPCIESTLIFSKSAKWQSNTEPAVCNSEESKRFRHSINLSFDHFSSGSSLQKLSINLGYSVEAFEETEFSELKSFSYQKLILGNEPDCGELLVVTGDALYTLHISKDFKLKLCREKISEVTFSAIEYYQGYYYALYSLEKLLLLSRDSQGNLQSLQKISFSFPENLGDISINNLELPHLQQHSEPQFFHHNIRTQFLNKGVWNK